MATSPNKPGLDASKSAGAAAAPSQADKAPNDALGRGRDALQALLAFSSLHEQIRQRRDLWRQLQEGLEKAVRTEDSPEARQQQESYVALLERAGVAVDRVRAEDQKLLSRLATAYGSTQPSTSPAATPPTRNPQPIHPRRTTSAGSPSTASSTTLIPTS